MQSYQKKSLPKRIILIRHGESLGNVDEKIFGITSDYKIPLTPSGMKQAEKAGKQILNIVSESRDWNVYFYVSPYCRTRETLKGIGKAFPKNRVIGVKEECRVREQDFGNFQDFEKMKELKEIRNRYGTFFYRFPEGESGADVFDRVSSFLESLWRDIDMNRYPDNCYSDNNLNLIIVSHGLCIRIFLMRWFKWTVEQFELLYNPKNAEYRVMELGQDGDYSLSIHHSDETLQAWGLSPEMIAEQKWRAKGDLSEKRLWNCEAFFDSLAETDESEDEAILGHRDLTSSQIDGSGCGGT
ncbi:hypothetical protein Leryth_025285 [Lithospermum erythrorhizon]|nr:hypothetical protein Leryth_025285 [Lithospermum erythrorhizon]